MLVNTVDLERGAPVIWGSPGLRDVYVQDAVYASCALPGYFPPGRIGDRLCVDGGVIDNLPVGIAALAADLIIAVDVGSTDLTPITGAMSLGFANIYMRAATTMMHALQQFPLTHWNGPPMVLIRPRCGEEWLSFSNISATIKEGHRSAHKALEDIDAFFDQPSGVYPRRQFELDVDRDKCIGCGLCVSLAPNLMALDAQGKAYARSRTVDWSPADGDFVHYCPTRAISARKTERIVPLKAGERRAQPKEKFVLRLSLCSPAGRRSGDPFVCAHRIVKLVDSDEFVVAMRQRESTGTEQIRRSPIGERGNVSGERGNRGLESIHHALSGLAERPVPTPASLDPWPIARSTASRPRARSPDESSTDPRPTARRRCRPHRPRRADVQRRVAE